MRLSARSLAGGAVLGECETFGGSELKEGGLRGYSSATLLLYPLRFFVFQDVSPTAVNATMLSLPW